MTISPGAEKGEFEPGNLSRITSFGRYLRKTKLDELPQLLNVLMGDMSLVGPRPEVKKWVAVYPERWAAIHKVRPGITDPASLIYRNEEALLAGSGEPEKVYREELLPQKLSLYEEYLRKRSFFMDFSIIMKTIFSVFRS
jgi:lipopolysaccharide/colanic/teichoic acid biosynthesis glycosyltransferase